MVGFCTPSLAITSGHVCFNSKPFMGNVEMHLEAGNNDVGASELVEGMKHMGILIQ